MMRRGDEPRQMPGMKADSRTSWPISEYRSVTGWAKFVSDTIQLLASNGCPACEHPTCSLQGQARATLRRI